MKIYGPAILSFALIFVLIQPAMSNDFSSRELLYDTVVEGLDDTDLTPEEKGEFEVKVEGWVDDLSDDQVEEFNQSLNNSIHNKFDIDFTDSENWALLDQAVVNDYNSQEIVALTKALESEAKFQNHYDRTGKEFFLEKADREKDKFLGKIDGFEYPEEPGDIEPPDETIEAEIELSKLDVMAFNKMELKEQMKNEARNEAKAMARETPRRNMRNDAKFAARDALKEVRSETRRANSKSRKPKKNK